jgi:hypothetical protein
VNHDVAAQLSKILDATQIKSPREFSIGQTTLTVPLDEDSDQAKMAGAKNRLIPLLQRTIYHSCFAREFIGTPWKDDVPPALALEDDLTSRLSEANHTRDRWDPGWRVYRIGIDGEVQVKKGDRHRSAVPGEFAFFAGPGIRAELHDVVSLQIVRESLVLQSGFYFAFSDFIPDQFDEFSTVRFYFHSSPEGAPLLLDALSRDLNRLQIPFRFKCQCDPRIYDRKDAIVLYVPARYFFVTAAVIVELPDAVTACFQHGVPLFCKRLGRGIGLAEDPGQLSSFGLHRCGLLAEALWMAWQSDRHSAADRMEAIDQHFRSEGLSLDAPYLNPGSVDHYELPAPVGVVP